MRRSRRFLLVATVAVAALAVAALAVVDGDDDPEAPAATSSTARPRRGSTTTPAPPTTASPPVTAPGSVPVEGALLDQPPGDLASFDGCEPAECARVTGRGGAFVVEKATAPDGTLAVHLYEEDGGRPVARTPGFPPGVEVFGVSLSTAEVDGEAVVVVDYDFNGSGSVHSFDVVAWDAGVPRPRVVAFVGGTGQDHVNARGDRLEFVGADYSDSAPTCCPTRAQVRTLTRSGEGEWVIETGTVPIEEAP